MSYQEAQWEVHFFTKTQSPTHLGFVSHLDDKRLTFTHVSSWSFPGPSSAVHGSGQGGTEDLQWMRVLSICCRVEGGEGGVRDLVSLLE